MSELRIEILSNGWVVRTLTRSEVWREEDLGAMLADLAVRLSPREIPIERRDKMWAQIVAALKEAGGVWSTEPAEREAGGE